MRARFRFEYGTRVPHSLVRDIERLTGEPLARNDSAYSRTKNVAAEGEEAEYVTEAIEPEDADRVLHVNGYQEYEADLELLLPLLPAGVKIEVQGIGSPQPIQELAAGLRKMEARLAAVGPSESYLNSKVDVHVPGNALLMIDQLKLEADACTDLVSEQLEEGWRIVAVCPQPDQRRPDYILGRQSDPRGLYA